MELSLTIRLENDGMQTGHDVADALAKVADNMRESFGDDRIELFHTLSVRDANGNRVGGYSVREEA